MQLPIVKQEPDEQDESQGPTFFEEFIKFIRNYEDSGHSRLEKKDDTFVLYEDLKLLIELSKENSINANVFSELSKQGFLNRSEVELKNRYKNFLSYIQQDDLQRIVEYLSKNEGFNSLLVFKDEGNKKYFVGVQDTVQSSIKKSVQKLTNTLPFPNFEPIPVPSNISQPPPAKIKIQNDEIQQQKPTDHLQTPQMKQKKLTEYRQFKEVHFNEEEVLPRKQVKTEHQASQPRQQIKQVSMKDLTETEVTQVHQLEYMIQMLSELTELPKKKIFKLLQQCSGDTNVLVDVLSNSVTDRLWQQDEDEILRKLNTLSPEDQQLRLRLLVRQKGKEDVQKRIKWLENK